MEQRVSLVTLGVRDLERSRQFYEALGWRPTERPGGDDVYFFQAGGLVVALWGRAELAADSAVSDAGGWGGVTLAYNTRSAQEVDEVLAEATSGENGGTKSTVPSPAMRNHGLWR